MIEGVIFDVDGTLVDSVDLHAAAWQEAFRRYGHELPFDTVRGQIGKGGDQLMPVFLDRDELARYGDELDAFRSDHFKRTCMDRVRPFPHVRDLLDRVRGAGLKVVLASSAKADELAVYKRIAGIEDLVDAETSSDDAERSKPFPDIFRAALDRAGLAPEAAVVVGDTPYDAQAAGRAGVPAIGVLCGGFPEEGLRAAGCVEIHRDPEELWRRFAQSVIGRTGGRPPD
ncbi:HAD family hydrolase [Azospirillum sp. ST 5-10]|uniref:HAD family hydrolase n=1 Tax=unclassified Azospirillum TaxID=2630922 RepID=UPI003F49C693